MKIDFTTFGSTETKYFSRNFTVAVNPIVEVTNVVVNPKNKKVLFVSFNKKDLNRMVNTFDGTPLSKELKELNRFAVYKFQLKKDEI